MSAHNPIQLVVFILGSLVLTAHAQIVPEPPSHKDAMDVISTHEQIKASLYKIIRVTPGKQLAKDGFLQDNVARITAFAPASAGRPERMIKHYLMQYSEEYGWFLESQRTDARGVYLEISSQKMGRVFLR
jgi:hypothetical protein